MEKTEFSTLNDLKEYYQDIEDKHKFVHAFFTSQIALDRELLTFREHIEKNEFGFGDRAFYWLWKLIVDQCPESFSFLEVGVYKGQTPTLISLLARKSNKSARTFGVSPLDDSGDDFSHYEATDYRSAIMNLQTHADLRGSERVRLIAGRSNDDAAKTACRSVAPFNVIYIDGSHRYEDVVEDIIVYREMLMEGGFFVMDDASYYLSMPEGVWRGHPDVSQAVQTYMVGHPDFEEIGAVGHLRVWKKATQMSKQHLEKSSLSPRSVILGYCANYGAEQLEPFLSSWKRNCPNAEMVLFVSNMKPDFFPVVDQLGVHLEDASPYLNEGIHPLIQRFRMWHDFLHTSSRTFDMCMLSDVRDVVFQSDPFAHLNGRQIVFAAEDKKIVDEQIWNARWIRELYGVSVLDEIEGHWISCAGTTLGTREAVGKYLNFMKKEIDLCKADMRVNYDQGIHNYVVRIVMGEEALVDESDSIVNTLISVDWRRIAVANDYVLIDGQVAPVLHQYDRIEPIEKLISSSLRYSYSGLVAL